ncbi:MAG: hypothetical protein KDA31_11905 [Phycisphaerales bacterium]|nr:hypothetical protein [Phycisphaerales bacterium]MCB9836568.1 hypothetical protein [Phycisphaera sp.]
MPSASNIQPAGEHIALADARRKFHRVLATWAIDLFELRARGLDRPSARRGRQDKAIAPSLQDWAARKAA